MAAFQKNNESIFCLDFAPAGLIYHVSHMLLSLKAFQGFSVRWEFLLKACFVLNYLDAHLKIKYLLGQVIVGKQKAESLWNKKCVMQKLLWPGDNQPFLTSG